MSIFRTKKQVLLLVPQFVLLAVMYAYPVVRTLVQSFYNATFGSQAQEPVGLANYKAIFADSAFWAACLNSLYWTGGNLVVQLTIPLFLALLLNEKFKGVNVARATFLLPWVVPNVAFAVCMRWMLLPRIGIVAEILNRTIFPRMQIHVLGNGGLAMPTMILLNSWKFLPFGTLMILASLQTIPREIYEAAMVDGAGAGRSFRYITFPFVSAMIWFMGFLAFSWNFNSFDLIWLMTQGGPGSSTQTLPVLIYRTAFKTMRLGEASTISVVIAVVLAALGVLYFLKMTPKKAA